MTTGQPINAVDEDDEVAVRRKSVEEAMKVGDDLVVAGVRVHDSDGGRTERRRT